MITLKNFLEKVTSTVTLIIDGEEFEGSYFKTEDGDLHLQFDDDVPIEEDVTLLILNHGVPGSTSVYAGAFDGDGVFL